MVSLDLRRLRLLLELRERRTLAAVADALGYSPSAISQQLAVLEREVRVPLLEPAGRGVRLTETGQVLAGHAAQLLAAAEAALADLDAAQERLRGRVHAVGVQSAMRRLLIPATAAMGQAYPQVRVELSELELEEAMPELLLGHVDLVIVDEYKGRPRPRPAGARFDPLLTERVRIVLPAAHPAAAGGGAVRLADLREEIWAASDRETGHTAMVLAACREHGGFDPDLRHRSSDAGAHLELVRHAGAVALLSDLSLPTQPDPLIAVRDVAEAPLGRRLFVVTRHGNQPRALRELIGHLRLAAEGRPAVGGRAGSR